MTTWMLGRILWAAAILPPLVLLLDIYRRDRVEKEPPKLLAALFFGGAVSVLPAALLERAGFALAGRILPAASVPHAALCCFAAVGLVEEGDRIAIDIPGRSITLKVSDAELAARKARWVCPEPRIKTGYLARYAKLVSSADRGAVLE